MRLTKDERQKLLDVTVTVLRHLRAEYLAAGASPLRHWDQIQDRLRAATWTCSSAPEWATRLQRDLRLAAPSSYLSASTEALCRVVEEIGDRRWLDWMASEYGLVMAKCRLECERRRQERDDRAPNSEYGIPEEDR